MTAPYVMPRWEAPESYLQGRVGAEGTTPDGRIVRFRSQHEPGSPAEYWVTVEDGTTTLTSPARATRDLASRLYETSLTGATVWPQ